LAESAVLREALGPERYEAVLTVRRAEAELFAMFTDADVIKAVRWRY
jgi:glutamine synthetase